MGNKRLADLLVDILAEAGVRQIYLCERSWRLPLFVRSCCASSRASSSPDNADVDWLMYKGSYA